MNIYQEQLMDHYRSPRNKGVIEHPDFSSEQLNPSCGDAVTFMGMCDGNVITKVAFQGHGCVISQATASLLSEQVIGKTVDQLMALAADDIITLIKMPLGPTRLKCALLPLQAVQEGLRTHIKQ